MSYILDALRKSAEERRKLQEQKPQSHDPLSIAHTSESGKRRSSVPLLLLCLILLVMGGGGWFYVSRIITPEQPLAELTAQVKDNEPAASPIAGGREEEQAPVQSEAAAQQADKAAVEITSPATQSEQELVQQDSSAEPARQQSVSEETGTKEKSSTPPPAPLLTELPFATQAAIPEMKFSGHVFSSDPGLRMIMANTSIVREGDIIAPDIKLVEITENGLVLSYQQTMFRIELF